MIARDIERVWRDEVPVAPKHGEVGNGRSRASGTTSTGSTERADGILARLKRDNPDLARRVIDGEITANAEKVPNGTFLGIEEAPGQ